MIKSMSIASTAELEELRGHVAQGERHITEQRARIKRMQARGEDLTAALDLLETFLATQALHEEHLARRLRG